MKKNKKFLYFFLVLMLILASVFYFNKIQKENTKIFECGDDIFDYEGDVYKTAKIGDNCWTTANLNSSKNNEGKNIKTRCYENNLINCNSFGGLYDYRTAFDGGAETPVKGICPSGWSIPSKDEYNSLLKELIIFDLCEGDTKEGKYICEKDNYLNEIGKNFLNSDYGGSCDLVCDYEECVYNCSGLECRHSFIYYDKSENNRFVVGGRVYVDSCGEEKVKIGFLDGGFDSLLSVRCVKD
jgi:uncharacterized protein (TIGR02145 family)